MTCSGPVLAGGVAAVYACCTPAATPAAADAAAVSATAVAAAADTAAAACLHTCLAVQASPTQSSKFARLCIADSLQAVTDSPLG